MNFALALGKKKAPRGTYTVRGNGDDYTDTFDDARSPELDGYLKDLDETGRPMLPSLPAARRTTAPTGAPSTTMLPSLPGNAQPRQAAPSGPTLADGSPMLPLTDSQFRRLRSQQRQLRADQNFYDSTRNNNATNQDTARSRYSQVAAGVGPYANASPQARADAAVNARRAAQRADQASGGAISNRDFVYDANDRLNEQSAADVNRTNAEAEMLPDVGTLYYGQGQDAQSRAKARTALQTPMTDLATQRARAAETQADYAPKRAEAGINKVQAEANQTNAYGAAAVELPKAIQQQLKAAQDENRQLRQRVSHLEGQAERAARADGRNPLKQFMDATTRPAPVTPMLPDLPGHHDQPAAAPSYPTNADGSPMLPQLSGGSPPARPAVSFDLPYPVEPTPAATAAPAPATTPGFQGPRPTAAPPAAAPAATPAPAPAPTTQPAAGNLPRVASMDEAMRLPKGAKFISPDGVIRIR